MNKKKIYFISSIIVLLVCISVYFAPLSLSNIIRECDRIDIILNEFEVENGIADIEAVTYNEITVDQKEAVSDLFDKFIYRRTIGTLFSNGTIKGLGDKTLTIFTYDDNSSVAAIVMATSGKMSINDKSYRCANAAQIIEHIVGIMEASD